MSVFSMPIRIEIEATDMDDALEKMRWLGRSLCESGEDYLISVDWNPSPPKKETIMRIIGNLGHEDVIWAKDKRLVTYHGGSLKVYETPKWVMPGDRTFFVDEWKEVFSAHIPEDMWVYDSEKFLARFATLI
jgi:hypothetical protein